jgi:hypothetical protein
LDIVAANDDNFSKRLVASNSRYLEFIGGAAHPRWLDMNDAKRFTTSKNDKNYMKYMFIRKVKDEKFIEWIRLKHLRLAYSETVANPNRCQFYRLTESTGCLKHHIEMKAAKSKKDCERGSYSSQVADVHNWASKYVVVIAVSKDKYEATKGLHHRLNGKHLHKIVYWSLDVNVHDKLIQRDLISIYLPELCNSTEGGATRWKSTVLGKILDQTEFRMMYIDLTLHTPHAKYLSNEIQNNPADVFLISDFKAFNDDAVQEEEEARREDDEPMKEVVQVDEAEVVPVDKPEVENKSLEGASLDEESNDASNIGPEITLTEVTTELSKSIPNKVSSTDFLMLSNTKKARLWLSRVENLILADPSLSEIDALNLVLQQNDISVFDPHQTSKSSIQVAFLSSLWTTGE